MVSFKECMRRFRDLSERMSRDMMWSKPDGSSLRVLKCNEILDPKFSQNIENNDGNSAGHNQIQTPSREEFLYDLKNQPKKANNSFFSSKIKLVLPAESQTQPSLPEEFKDFMKRIDESSDFLNETIYPNEITRLHSLFNIHDGFQEKSDDGSYRNESRGQLWGPLPSEGINKQQFWY